MPESFTQVPPDSTGKKLSAIEEVLGGNTVHVQRTLARDAATFHALFDRIAPAANKYMAMLFNTSATRVVKIHRVWSYNWQTAAVTGLLHDHELTYVTARTQGTAVSPVPLDSNDALSAGITADHGSTAVTEGLMVRRFFGISEEAKPGALTLESSLNGSNPNALIFDADARGTRPLTLRQGRGLAVKLNTSTTVGSGSFVFEFTDEPI